MDPFSDKCNIINQSKLNPAPNLKKALPRKRLELPSNFLQSTKKALSLIAPAGYGKSTVLTQWKSQLEGLRLDNVWISFDEQDNNPSHFIQYLLVALATIDEKIGYQARCVFQSGSLPSLKPLMNSLLAELSQRHESLFIIFDDLHYLHCEEVLGFLEMLFLESPTSLRLLIGSRHKPPLPWSRLRSQNLLLEWGIEELRFNSNEINQFFNHQEKFSISKPNLQILKQKTEGWVVALQLISLVLKSTTLNQAFIDEFTGTDRDISDYLAAEVLQSQPEDMQEFLLKTSVLDRMSGELCEAASGMPNGQKFLELVESKNLFLIPLDRQRKWYRYHHLFQSFLQAQLYKEHPKIMKAAYQNASQWWKKQGNSVEAIAYAIKATDYDQAAQLIAEQALDWVYFQGNYPTMVYWVQKLPRDYSIKYPFIKIAYSTALILTLRFNEAEFEFQNYEANLKAIQNCESNHLASQIKLLEPSMNLSKVLRLTILDEMPEWQDKSEAWLKENGETATPHEVGTAYACLGSACIPNWQFSKGMNNIQKAVQVGLQNSNPALLSWAIAIKGLLLMEQGALPQAVQNYQEGRKELMGDQKIHGFLDTMISVQYAEALYEQGDIIEAKKMLQEGMGLKSLIDHGAIGTVMAGYSTAAKLAWVEGQYDLAKHHFATGQTLAQKRGWYRAQFYFAAEAIQLWSRLGELNTAQACALEYGLQKKSSLAPKAYQHLFDQFSCWAQSRIFLAQNKPELALTNIEKNIHSAKQRGASGYFLKFSIIKILAHLQLGEASQAYKNLYQVLKLASSLGFVQPFVEEGKLLAAAIETIILRELQESRQELPHPFLKKLSIALQLYHSTLEDFFTLASVVPEKLNRREKEILKLLDSDLDSHALARSVKISQSTLKWHLHNIYQKLGVKGRSGAVAKARLT